MEASSRPFAAASAVVLVAVLAMSPAARAQVGPDQPDGRGTDTFVTIAARECDDYTDIRANRARNDIMESLQDLGADTLYTAGEPVNPPTERRGQPSCRPITDWRFTLGSGYRSQAVDGPWGSLSIVTDPDAQAIATLASTAARDYQGVPVGDVSIPGAVTIELTDDQLERSGRNALWLQGGTPDDPVLYGLPQFAGRYGFGALRCAIDDLNGDNVETIQFPAGARHAFCYAYYVTPPPSSGTIVIRKEVAGAGAVPETFPYSGTLSYNPGGAFELQAGPGAPGQTSFYRAETRPGDAPWTVIEEPPPGWLLDDLSCVSGASSTSTDRAGGRVDIRLTAGDTVTCSYTNRLTPPVGALLVRKVTENGVGTFTFRVSGDGGDVFARASTTTTREGRAQVVGRPLELDPGRYRIEETPRPTRAGRWELRSVSCNGRERPAREPVSVEVAAGSGSVCTFTNRLERPGRIDISKLTRGGTGTAAFIVSPVGDPDVQRRQTATTRAAGRPVAARGQSTAGLPFGRYVIQESAALPAQRGEWALVAVLCDGRLVPFEQGRVVVSVTRRNFDVDCVFINQRLSEPAPPDPPGPDPVPGELEPDLVLTKSVRRAGTGATPRAVFEISVANRGRASATGVVVGDRLPRGMRLASARPSRGRCTQRRLVICRLGTIQGGGSATVVVTAFRWGTAAAANVAVLGSGSPDARSANNRDRGRVGARRPAADPCAASNQPARSAC